MGFDSPGVNEEHLPAEPLTVAVDAVPGDARGIVDDGEALSDEFVEQGRFADVGPSYDGNNWFGQVTHLLFFDIINRKCHIYNKKGGEVSASPPSLQKVTNCISPC